MSAAPGNNSNSGAPSATGGARPHRKRGASSLPFLLFLALFFLAQAFSSSFRNLIDDSLGVERMLSFGIGFLCLHSAWLAFDTSRLRERLLDLLAETMRALRAGASGGVPQVPSFDVPAVEILVKALGSANVEARQSARTHLVRLTGQDLGDDPARWSAWLAASRPGGAKETPGDKS